MTIHVRVMLLLMALGCADTPGAAPAAGDADDTGTAFVPVDAPCPATTPRSDGTITVRGELTADPGRQPAPGARIHPCGADAPSTTSRDDGTWALDLPDHDWVAVDMERDDLIPGRNVFDPMLEGVEQNPYRIKMGGTSIEDFPMEHLGVLPRPGKTWLDVDALDGTTGIDLAGVTIDITAPYDLAITQDLDGTFVEGNVGNGAYDILFANVDPVEFDILVTHPDGWTCRVPGPLGGRGNDQLNVSVYCSE